MIKTIDYSVKYPLNLIVSRVNKWILGCNEVCELESCEKYIQNHIQPRNKEANFQNYMHLLLQSLQVTRMEIEAGLKPKSSNFKPLNHK